ncbi:peptidogalycan biosysnthesis protein [Paracidovorax konjaci]|uniref:Acetyltransferase (GNAT) domain-containing protein n=1 Tax=Paracidovorax konjaci TaxID=32040 RepID=A0A1I1VV81_9BURK|nr:peptidogalycan biosysnthesis protein [Paracidovorax konjaci]SFD86745.1 Acetyltransferase (GNAT) domain-containing protein [Paracidovorax konjaci]
MRWRNRLEPPSLVEHARVHPPEGFACLDGLPAPAFTAPFDLLTTADDALKARLRTWPMFARWSRWLRVRTAFIGATVTEYAPLPADGITPAALAAAVRQGPGRSHALAIVKDIPQDSPLLDDADNVFAQRLAEACVAEGFVLVEGQALAYVPIDFNGVDGYLARLSASRRSNLRRKLRSRAALRIERVPTGKAFADDARVDAYYALYEGVHAQSEVHFDRLTRSFFAAVLRDGTSGGIAFEYRHAESGALLGWNLCYEHGGRLVDKYIGLSYPAAREVNLYFVSWMVNLEYALERGLTHYIAGWTDPEVKRSLGARFTWTRHAVHVRNPLLRALARRFAGHFESDSHWRAQVEGRNA